MRSRSKRVPLALKYKIKKNVREHNRKLKKGGGAGAAPGQSTASKIRKDPGVPNLWPFKEQLLIQREAKREHADMVKQKQKLQREKLLEKRRNASIADLQKAANKKQAEFDKKHKGDGSSMDVEHNTGRSLEMSRRAFYREFKKVVTSADVILEVLDARDPLGCRCPQIEKRIMSLSPNKKIVLVLNKIDLVPREVVEKWLKHFRLEFPTIAFKASTQSQRTNLGHSNVSTATASSDLLSSSECLGADTLVKLLKNYSRNADIKTTVTVGIIGQPNVGKSSIINSLKRSKACNVGPTPGVTRQAQEIHLDKNIKLLDCPGIVFPDESGTSNPDNVLRGAVKIEQIEDPAAHVEIVLNRCPRDKIMELYNLPLFESPAEFLVMLAQKRGKLKKGGVADIDVVARSILQDWNSGRIPYYTLPPAEDASIHLKTEIVSTWGKEFDMQSLEKDQSTILAGLRTEREQGLFIPMNAGEANQLDVDLEELDNLASDEEEDEDDDDEEDAEMEQAEPEATGVGLQNIAEIALIKGKQKKALEEYRQAQGAAAPVAQLSTAAKRQAALIAAEDALNPQTGKQLKKAQKNNKKAQRRSARTGGMNVDDDDEEQDDEPMSVAPAKARGNRFAVAAFADNDGAYDFATDFTDNAMDQD
ncbi:Gnl3l protein [Capsaspora owczarzaki ATCC 30864]|uniref:Gnl3l protein n=1 Tax=Capsaspora owczarzaki (strain ATCC 30864) TaxID=595528 RepID=UPI0003520D42|nr:Gnl3l protein [Capsaspora owczarzaki ATCC 30864]|eukprot:XP_004363980.2 Gnl3l protein [Capsaspora owczarzaki ATCC 30864]